MNFKKAGKNPPAFLQQVLIYSNMLDCTTPAIVTRNPFMETDDHRYWMFKNPISNEYQWSAIMPDDLWIEKNHESE